MSVPVIDGAMPTGPASSTPEVEEKKTEGVEEKVEETVPPEVLRKKLTEANAEAASYRTQLRAAQDEAKAALDKAKTVDEYKVAVDNLNARIAELESAQLRSEIAREVGLPHELATRLQGATKEELTADATALKGLLGVGAPSTPKGGLNPQGALEEDFDPYKVAAALGQSSGVRFY